MEERTGLSQMVNDLLDSAQNCRRNCKSRELAINSKTKNTMTLFLILDHLHENIGILGSEEYGVSREKKRSLSDEMFGR